MTKSLTIAFFLVLTAHALAETPEQFFDQANQAYQQGKFAEAVQKYEQILSSGVANGELYYNLGNAYYKSGSISKAILNYERAARFMPADDDLRHNLQLANLGITDRIDPAPRLFFWDWWDTIKASASLASMTWICYVFYVLMIGAVALASLAPSYAKRRIAFIGGLACLFFLIFGIIVFVGKLNEANSVDSAIVVANITTVKNSPDLKSTDAFVLHGGVRVLITDKVSDWYKIRLADGKVGWMEQKAVEII